MTITRPSRGQAAAGLATTARVTSATPLSKDEQASLKVSLAKRFGRDLTLSLIVDPNILGGLIVQVGDVVIDGGLAAKLTALQDQLLQGGG